MSTAKEIAPLEQECTRLREALAVAERESSQLLELINAPETAVLREALAAAESRASAAERERDEARADCLATDAALIVAVSGAAREKERADAAMELLKECGEVLEPFVEVANVYPKWADNARATCPMSDYRRARALLARIREAGK